MKNSLSMIHVPADIEISIEILEASKITVDPTLMKRVFINFILNAVQAMHGGGKLAIKTFRTEEGAFISFQDTGVGIPKEHMEMIWSPLYTTKAKGTGLGLTTCQHIEK